MKVEKTFINGLLVITPDIFPDQRGFFFESYSFAKYYDQGLKVVFVQDNISKSKFGTVRGLHYQHGEYAQGKLCTVIVGKVLDVALDIRFGSPTFGKHFSIELDSDKKNQIWIPPGFAHGFSVLSDEALFSYKCTSPYNKEFENAVLFNDPELKIDWKIKEPIVSQKDLQSVKFKDIQQHFKYEED